MQNNDIKELEKVKEREISNDEIQFSGIKVLSLQIAFFCKNINEDVYSIGEKISNQLKGAQTSDLKNIEKSINVQNQSAIAYNFQGYKLLVSSERIDLVTSSNLFEQKGVSYTVQEEQKILRPVVNAIFEVLGEVKRIGIVLTSFVQQNASGELIFSKVFDSSIRKVKEASIRINIGGNVDDIELNNILSIDDGIIKNNDDGREQFGAIIIRDINSVPSEDVLLRRKDYKKMWAYALHYFTDEKMEALK